MERRELKFVSGPKRLKDAPFCPCGQENNKKNPQFAPFAGTDGKFGYCHRCDRQFMPGDTAEVTYDYTPAPQAKQQFMAEPAWNWGLTDSTISDKTKPLTGVRTVTWYYRDVKGRLTSAKAMDYSFPEFRRVKDHHPVHLTTRDSGYYPCLFLEHHLTKYPKAAVILVESEKTAAILTARFRDYLEEFIYIATAGTSGLTGQKLGVLKGRTVLICFDCDNGEVQEDGTVIKPKGREAAQDTYLKLAAVASASVIEIDAALTDGTDLADLPKETVTIGYIRDLPSKDVTRAIPPAVIDELRRLNREALNLTDARADELGRSHGINVDRIHSLNRTVLEQWKSEFGIAKSPLNERIKHWLNKNYEFRRNVITGIVMMRRRGGPWEDINSATVWDDINCDARSIGRGKKGGDISIARTTIENFLDSGFVPAWNPLTEYFESLPPWDGKTDHIALLANHVKTDSQEFWVEQFRKALRRMIACSIGGQVNRVVITLVSEQQMVGKSSFIRHICPPALRELYKEEPLIHSKDAEIALCENFIWNLEELDNLNRGEISAMKAIISRASVKQRRSYARHEKYMPRIVNFWGSTNKNDFLTDTENTRWLCFNVLSVSHDYNNTVTRVKNVDINQVWAQAYRNFLDGEPYELTTAERSMQSGMNREFEADSAEKQLILKHFKRLESRVPGCEFMTNLEIRMKLDTVSNAKTRLSDLNVGRSMKQLGYDSFRKRIDGKTTRGYYVLFSEKGWNYDDEKPEPPPVSDELPF